MKDLGIWKVNKDGKGKFVANANKIVPIKTHEHIDKRLLRMTGDKKRYGGGPTRSVDNA